MIKKSLFILCVLISGAIFSTSTGEKITLTCKGEGDYGNFLLSFIPASYWSEGEQDFIDESATVYFSRLNLETAGRLEGEAITEMTRLKGYYRLKFEGYWALQTQVNLTISPTFHDGWGDIEQDYRSYSVTCFE